jgi:hypothetical protein
VAAKLREEGFPDAWAIERGLAGCAEAGLRIGIKVPAKC